MDLLLLSTVFCSFLFLFFLYKRLLVSESTKGKISVEKKRAPQAAGAWPLIGHLHLLGGSSLPHITLGSLADKYGPIFTIKLGLKKALIVSDWETAKECLTTNDKAFATRPKSIAAEIMGYDHAMFGLAPYGPYWRQIRKIALLELLSNRRVEILAGVRKSEVEANVRDLHEHWLRNRGGSNTVKVEMKQWCGNLIDKMVVRILVGKQYSFNEEEGKRCQAAIRKFFELLGTFVLGDAVPFLRCLDVGGHEKAMRKIAKEMDQIVQGWLQDHKRKRNSAGEMKDGDETDFIDVLLTILDSDTTSKDLPGFDPDTIIKATSMTLLSAATDTTMVTLTWALSLLLNNLQVLQKLQEELDTHVGNDRNVQEDDINKLVYLQAVVKETLRLYPAGPLSVPHEAMEDCEVRGFRIPKGTRLLVNLWKLQRDPNVWSEPNEFRPERFLTTHKDTDVRGQHFELIPFSSGRRMCPGISLALQVLHFTLARLVHGFELSRPSDEPIDMSETLGLTNMKATPLEVLVAPRLSSDLYAA